MRLKNRNRLDCGVNLHQVKFMCSQEKCYTHAMISKNHKGARLLQIDNFHSVECGAPPTVDARGKFVSYFENGFGEQWVLVGDKACGKAVVYAGDCHLGKPMEASVDQPYPGATLQEAEKMWLVACLTAMGNKRFDYVLIRYNAKQSGSEN